MPERLLILSFVSAVIDNVPSPVPDVLESVSHSTSDETVHDWLEVTVRVLLPPEKVKDADVGVTLNVGVAPSCETLTV